MKNNDAWGSTSTFSDPIEKGEIERELEAGEKLLWAGRPASAFRKREEWSTKGYHLVGVAFSLLWMGGVSSGLVEEIRSGQTPELLAFLFPLLGIFFVGGVLRDWLRSEGARAGRTFYGVTNRRAMIVRTGKKREVRSFLPQQIQLGRREDQGNLGDILLNDARLLEKERSPTSFRLHTPQKSDEELEREIAFLSIENPREVERLIRHHLLDKTSNFG